MKLNLKSLVLKFLSALLTAHSLAALQAAESDSKNTASTRGITGIAPDPAVRRQTPDAPASKLWLYQVALPFQVSSTQAAIFCNLREALAQGVDFEVGNDAIVFGSLGEIATVQPVLLNRNHAEPNPKTSPAGQPATMVKYPIRGGFVPLGAKQSDGSPHPGAGTGFGLSMVQAWKVLVDGPPPYQQNGYSGAESYSYWEFQQFAFDGTIFRVTATHRIGLDKLLPGWIIPNGGMTNAIPDGTDLLVAMVGKEPKVDFNGVRPSGSGFLRFRRESGEWRPISFNLVPGSTGLFEPSLVRDTDGTLLFSGRGGSQPNHRNDIRIWRSKDSGQTWAMIIEVKGVVSPAPITLNQAADGTPFITANLQSVMPGHRDPLSLSAKGGRAVEAGKNSRSTLSLWPLKEDRSGLAEPISVRDCRAEFGPPTGGSNWTWRADHPSAMTVRLADGKWHTLLGVRVQDYREIKEAMAPTPHTGMYVHEVISTGPPHAIWNF
jgi:hypothetical protein